MTDKKTWRAQERQDMTPCSIEVDGVSDWKSLFQEETELEGAWAIEAGGSNVSYYQYCITEARVNNVSIERTIFAKLMRRGYVLEELEIEFGENNDKHAWGPCVWKKSHATYRDPSPWLKESLKEPNEYAVSLFAAMFDTENAGEQKFGLASTQMFGAQILGKKTNFLFHKTIIFRRARFSQPEQQKEVAA